MRENIKSVDHRGHRVTQSPLWVSVPSVVQAFCIPSKIAKGGAASLVCLPFFLILLALAIPSAASDALAKDAHADRVLVLKSERTLELLDHGKILKKYKVALGGAPVGKKEK